MLYAVVDKPIIPNQAEETTRHFTDLVKLSKVGMSQWAQGFPLAHAEGRRSLAEVEEGESEAHQGVEAEEIRP